MAAGIGVVTMPDLLVVWIERMGFPVSAGAASLAAMFLAVLCPALLLANLVVRRSGRLGTLAFFGWAFFGTAGLLAAVSMLALAERLR